MPIIDLTNDEINELTEILKVGKVWADKVSIIKRIPTSQNKHYIALTSILEKLKGIK